MRLADFCIKVISVAVAAAAAPAFVRWIGIRDMRTTISLVTNAMAPKKIFTWIKMLRIGDSDFTIDARGASAVTIFAVAVMAAPRISPRAAARVNACRRTTGRNAPSADVDDLHALLLEARVDLGAPLEEEPGYVEVPGFRGAAERSLQALETSNGTRAGVEQHRSRLGVAPGDGRVEGGPAAAFLVRVAAACEEELDDLG